MKPNHSSTNRGLMDRMDASNRPIRMIHGTTTRNIMVPLNRDTTTPLESGTTQRNLTTPLNSGTVQRDTTTQYRITELNALQTSSSYVPAQWMSPYSLSSLTVPTSYRAQVPIPPPGSRFSAPPYSLPPPYITPSNISTTSKFPKRSQYTTPPYVPPYSCPPYTTQSSMPVYTSLSLSLTYTSQSTMTSNTYQTSISSIRSQSSASAYSPRYSTPTDSTAYSVPTNTSRPSTSTYNLSPPLRMNPRSAHYSASPSYSHYTFPRSAHYMMPFLGTYCTEMPQSSTQNSYRSSTYESSINVWPTEIGSVMQASMENIRSVLATQLQNASQSSTTARSDLIARRVNDQSLKCVNPKPSDSINTASNSCARNQSKQSEEKLIPLKKNVNDNINTHCSSMQDELKNAWVYFNKLEIVDIKPNGEIKCICPMIQFEDLLMSSTNNKRILVDLYRYYKTNNLLFETTYDYNSSPQNTIVTENIENEVLEWLTFFQIEEYDWFFNSLSLYEIENISPTNIQKFIMRSKSNKTISLEDQLKICCIAKKIKERPVSLIAISMNLQEERIDEASFMRTVSPYVSEIFLLPMSIDHFLLERTMEDVIFITMTQLQIYMVNAIKIDAQLDTNRNTGDSLVVEMVNSEIIYSNQLLT